MDAFSRISQVRITGTSSGAVKTLRGYDKSRHSLPEAVNATTNAFLARLCSAELAEEAEAVFQQVRSALGYKRTQLGLEVGAGQALLTTKDFTWELNYAFEPTDPSHYVVTRELHGFRSSDLPQLAEFNTLWTGQFDAVVFDLVRGVQVEKVIDAIEARDAQAEGALEVNYPSDGASCVITVSGVAARVECDGATVILRLPRSGTPLECLHAFAAVRAAFRLNKDRVLSGLLG